MECNHMDSNGDLKFECLYKNQLDDIRPLINADMIEIQKGYDTDISNRSFEMFATKSKAKPI